MEGTSSCRPPLSVITKKERHIRLCISFKSRGSVRWIRSVTAENLMYRFYHGRIFYALHRPLPHRDILSTRRFTARQIFFRGSPRFSLLCAVMAMTRLFFKINLIEFGDSKCIVLLDGMRQCVDDGIACDENAVRTDVFPSADAPLPEGWVQKCKSVNAPVRRRFISSGKG